MHAFGGFGGGTRRKAPQTFFFLCVWTRRAMGWVARERARFSPGPEYRVHARLHCPFLARARIWVGKVVGDGESPSSLCGQPSLTCPQMGCGLGALFPSATFLFPLSCVSTCSSAGPRARGMFVCAPRLILFLFLAPRLTRDLSPPLGFFSPSPSPPPLSPYLRPPSHQARRLLQIQKKRKKKKKNLF